LIRIKLKGKGQDKVLSCCIRIL